MHFEEMKVHNANIYKKKIFVSIFVSFDHRSVNITFGDEDKNEWFVEPNRIPI
jgi:hypothetical protein